MKEEKPRRCGRRTRRWEQADIHMYIVLAKCISQDIGMPTVAIDAALIVNELLVAEVYCDVTVMTAREFTAVDGGVTILGTANGN